MKEKERETEESHVHTFLIRPSRKVELLITHSDHPEIEVVSMISCRK